MILIKLNQLVNALNKYICLNIEQWLKAIT